MENLDTRMKKVYGLQNAELLLVDSYSTRRILRKLDLATLRSKILS